jgi:hypothetical protein
MITEMLDSGRGDVNWIFNEDGLEAPCTSLSLAHHPIIVKKLLDAKAYRPHDCQSVFRAACTKLQLESVKMLLDAGMMPFGETSRGAMYYAFHAECTDEQADDKTAIVNLLMSAKGNISSPKGWDPLNECLQADYSTNRAAIVKGMLLSGRNLLGHSCKYTKDPFFFSCTHPKRDPDVVSLFLDRGQSNNDISNAMRYLIGSPGFNKHTVQSSLCPQRSRDILQMLIHAGACLYIILGKRTLLIMMTDEYSRVPDGLAAIMIGDILDAMTAQLLRPPPAICSRAERK